MVLTNKRICIYILNFAVVDKIILCTISSYYPPAKGEGYSFLHPSVGHVRPEP